MRPADRLILLVAGTVCALVLILASGIIVIELVRPSTDTSGAAASISAVVSTLVGLLAGFLGGRTETIRRRRNGNDVVG